MSKSLGLKLAVLASGLSFGSHVIIDVNDKRHMDIIIEYTTGWLSASMLVLLRTLLGVRGEASLP